MAEIEFFWDPLDPSHSKYDEIKDFEVPLLDKTVQESGKEDVHIAKISHFVDTNVVCNQIMAYFIVRTYLFLT